MKWAARGSQLQVQRYIEGHREELAKAVLEQVPDLGERAEGLAWRAPLPPSFDEPRDAAFLRALDLEHLAPALAEFWPSRGPVWDALAVVRLRDGGAGVLLCEGKSHPAEVYGSGTKATEPSRTKIAQALEATQTWLGVEPRADLWMDPLRPDQPGHSSVYQSANRYAHLYWLRELQGIEAWLVHLLFVDDPTYGTTSRAEWDRAMPAVEEDLGLEGKHVPFAAHVFLPGLAGR